MSDDWADRVAEKVRSQQESTHEKNRLETLRKQRIQTDGPRLWEQLETSIRRNITALNARFVQPVCRMSPPERDRIIVTKTDGSNDALVADFDSRGFVVFNFPGNRFGDTKIWVTGSDDVYLMLDGRGIDPAAFGRALVEEFVTGGANIRP